MIQSLSIFTYLANLAINQAHVFSLSFRWMHGIPPTHGHRYKLRGYHWFDCVEWHEVLGHLPMQLLVFSVIACAISGHTFLSKNRLAGPIHIHDLASPTEISSQWAAQLGSCGQKFHLYLNPIPLQKLFFKKYVILHCKWHGLSPDSQRPALSICH